MGKITLYLCFSHTQSDNRKIAWALAGEYENVEVVSTWPGGGNSEISDLNKIYEQSLTCYRNNSKVPTTVSYENREFQWGYQTGLSGDTIRGVKLLLDESQESRYSPALASKKILKRLDKDAVEVSGEYLRKLVSNVKEVLKRRFGEAFGSMEMRFILTVPAVWSDKAKDATWKAAVRAGISASDISLVSEPEAAALYCLRKIEPNSVTVILPHHTVNFWHLTKLE